MQESSLSSTRQLAELIERKHACLVQLRLAEARRLLREKVAPAEASALSGFADQSHMGRWFRRAYGMTPAAYRKGRTNVPEIAAKSR